MLRSLRSFSNLGQTKHVFCVFIIRLAEWAVRITFMVKPIQVVFKVSMSYQQLRKVKVTCPFFRPSHLCSSGISLYVHRLLLLLTHFSFHLAMVSSLHIFRRDSAVATPVLPARISADFTAGRSIGMTPYISNAASWDTVRNAQHTRRAHNLCTDPPSYI